MTKREKFGCVLLPLVTPYKENEEVDYDAYSALIERMIQDDLCDTFIVTGTTGEASLLTFDERVNLFKTAYKTVNGRKPVIAGTGCASTKETIALTKAAEAIGIETCLIVAPFYNKPDQEGLYNHYKAIAESTKVDIILYNIPIFVGVNLNSTTVARLAAFPNIIGIKDEAGINPTQVTDFFLDTADIDPNFLIYNGDDVMLLPTISQNAMGIVSGGGHIFGHEIREVFRLFAEGKNQEAIATYMPVYEFCRCFGLCGRILPNPMLRKAIEMVTGLHIGPARSPLTPVRPEEIEMMTKALKKANKL